MIKNIVILNILIFYKYNVIENNAEKLSYVYLFFFFSIDVDDCGNHDCQNGATCNDLINDFNCTCAAGFTGSKCETGMYNCRCKFPLSTFDIRVGQSLVGQPGWTDTSLPHFIMFKCKII